ncbi:hypothetical protein [Aeromonas hydrophila]|uniref:hypothetical protein n=1 Tax=Aeromonas hydrophila TaxID=644 RepID=UPI0003149BDC|nr:hypothetical protein [Aeromonas hydrophila]MBS4674109.1 hypothetical protein [Aeromonas hydrophila]SUU12211.1 Uncharacterised protein [Aeromonas hydrophila]
MKHVLLILLSWLLVLPVGAAETQPPRTALVADEGLQGHLDYLTDRLQLGQFAAIDTLLDSLAVGQREYLLCQLLATLNSQPRATSPQLLAWVRAQSFKAPSWLVDKEVDGFLVQQPAYDFAAAARQVLSRWQQQAWQDNYRQQLEEGTFEFKQIYNSRNPDLAQQQQALLTVLDRQPLPLLQREAHTLAAMSIFLPDNRLLRLLAERTGDSALYQKLWHQPVDHDSVAALASVGRFHQGQAASDLLIAASRNARLKLPALQQLSQLSPLPDTAQQFLLAELGNRQYSGQVASLLLQMDEPRLLAQLADRLTRQEKRHASPVMLPDSGTPAARPGL